ncbi:MAG: hypothetical protein J2P23_08735 [Microlunatus sp.]|nr:hypothetical protein [Microlunatus sp.]
MIKSSWPFLVGTAALIAAGLGLSQWVAGSGPSAQTQFGVAAAVLSLYTAVVSLLATDRDERTTGRSLLWGSAVPLAVAMITAAAVLTRTQELSGLLAALPWLAGPALSVPLGLVLPDFLRFGAWRR